MRTVVLARDQPTVKTKHSLKSSLKHLSINRNLFSKPLVKDIFG